MRLPRGMFLIACCSPLAASNVVAEPLSPPRLCLQPQCVDLATNPIFEVPITITGTGTLAAFGFDLSGSQDQFSLVDIIPGPLLAGWTHVEGTELRNQTIRVGGYNVTPSPMDGTEALLVTLRLRSQRDGASASLGLARLTDDIVTASSCTAVVSVLAPVSFPSGQIVFYPEGRPGVCCFPTPDGTRLIVSAQPDTHVRWGIRGASFRIEVSPPAPGATFTWVPSEDSQSSEGQPVDNAATLDGAGVRVLYGFCFGEPFVHENIVLGKIIVNGLTGIHALELKAVEPTHPAAIAAECAYFVPCRNCTVPKACITQIDRFPVSYRAIINSAECGEACGPLVGISAVDWGRVKALYRH